MTDRDEIDRRLRESGERWRARHLPMPTIDEAMFRGRPAASSASGMKWLSAVAGLAVIALVAAVALQTVLADPTRPDVGLASPTMETSAVPSPPPPTASPFPQPTATASSPAIAAIPGAQVLDRGPRVVADAPLGDLQAIAAARNELALDIYRVLAEEEGNVVLGPDSISNAVSMLFAGAGEELSAQLREMMRIPFEEGRFHAGAGALDASLSSADAVDGIELLRGTRLFGQQGYAFGEDFLATVSRDYGAPLIAVDYVGATEEARAAINAWVAELTRDLIPELMPQGSITPATVLVLTDAQYMKATWLTEFDPAKTRDLPFHFSPADTRDVPTMVGAMEIPWTGDETFSAAELPYVGERLAMLVVVPQDMAEFERDLSGERLDEIIGRLEEQQIPVSLPRFEAKQHSSLLDILQGLGMTAVGDLGPIGPGLFVSGIEHEAVVKVNEEGTEAAAATGGGFVTSAGPKPELRADRPFLFFVRDRLTGSILFMGRISDPTTTV